MIVDLTEDQVRQLRPLFEDVERAAGLGRMGMLVAQLYKDPNGAYHLRAGFVLHARAKEIIHSCTETLPTAPSP